MHSLGKGFDDVIIKRMHLLQDPVKQQRHSRHIVHAQVDAYVPAMELVKINAAKRGKEALCTTACWGGVLAHKWDIKRGLLCLKVLSWCAAAVHYACSGSTTGPAAARRSLSHHKVRGLFRFIFSARASQAKLAYTLLRSRKPTEAILAFEPGTLQHTIRTAGEQLRCVYCRAYVACAGRHVLPPATSIANSRSGQA